MPTGLPVCNLATTTELSCTDLPYVPDVALSLPAWYLTSILVYQTFLASRLHLVEPTGKVQVFCYHTNQGNPGLRMGQSC